MHSSARPTSRHDTQDLIPIVGVVVETRNDEKIYRVVANLSWVLVIGGVREDCC